MRGAQSVPVLTLACAVVTAFVGACAPSFRFKKDARPVVVDQEAYAVYAAVLAAEPAELPMPRVVAAETQRLRVSGCGPTVENASNPWRGAVDDFLAQNNTPHRILPRIPAPSSSYVVLTRDQIARRVRSTGHGGGHIEFSNVGFDTARTRAIVYREHVCHGFVDCGNGGDLFLEKGSDGWRTVKPVGVTGCGWIT